MTNKYYSCEFSGHWPVGAVMVIVAKNKRLAYREMVRLLKDANLYNDYNASKTQDDIIEITESQILLDGNY